MDCIVNRTDCDRSIDSGTKSKLRLNASKWPIVYVSTSPLGLPQCRQPVDLSFDQLLIAVGQMPGAAILGGAPGFGQGGRWSILAAEPIGHFQFDGRSQFWRSRLPGRLTGSSNQPGPTLLVKVDNPFPLLNQTLDILDEQVFEESGQEVESFEGFPPFRGGFIGFYSYDLAPWIERLPRQAERDPLDPFPEIFFRLYDTFVAFDHETETGTLWVQNLRGDSSAEIDERTRHWVKQLQAPPVRIPTSRFGAGLTSLVTPEEYQERVRRTVDYIEAGDIFQANISQRFDVFGEPEPLDLYRRLRDRSPAPYSTLIQLGKNRAVVSSSPELFFETAGTRIRTRPIKGTRPRGATPALDAANKAALESSSKDRAELTMIVDLERNDLGRISEFGSVRVLEAAAIESYATVHHQVATIEGSLRAQIRPAEIVRAVFPGGSITGAPKIRAMEIIDELEPTRRSLYTGAIGFISTNGRSAFNIAIRTILISGSRASYQVGGGIVAESDPLLEFEETLHKGRALREVIEECR